MDHALDSLMIHYIFNASAHLTTQWTISTVKPWLQDAKDPSLSSKIAELKGAKPVFDFLTRFPQYFVLGTSVSGLGLTRGNIRLESQCPHCRKLAKLHNKKGHTPTSPAQPSSSQPSTLPSSSQPSSSQPSSSQPSSSQPSSTNPTQQPYSCSHSDYFRAAYCVSSKGPLSGYNFKMNMLEFLKNHGQITQAEFIQKMTMKEFKPYIFALTPKIIELQGAKFAAVKGSDCNCPCLASPLSDPLGATSSTAPSSTSSTSAPHSSTVRPTTTTTSPTTTSPTTSGSAPPTFSSAPTTSSSTRTTSGVAPTTPGSTPVTAFPKSPVVASSSSTILSPSSTSSISSTSSSTPAIFTTTPDPVLSPALSSQRNTTTTSTTNTTTTIQPPSFVKKIGQFNFGLVENLEQCSQAVQYIKNFTQMAVDCEGVNLSATGKLCIIQIGVLSLHNELYTFIFDVIRLGKVAQFKEVCASLASIFQDSSKVKIMHDGRQDCSSLFHQLSISVNNIFDTQIAYRTLCEVKRGTASNDSTDTKRIGLNALLQRYSFPINPYKDTIHARMDQTGSEFWSVRPLSDDLIQYSVHDIASLIPLMAKLIDDMQYWVCESAKALSTKNSLSYINGSKASPDPTPNCLLELKFGEDYQCLYCEALDDDETINQQPTEFNLDEDTLTLSTLLPARIRSRVIQKTCEVKRDLIEIVMDHERPVALRFSDIDDIHLKEQANISESLKSLADGISGITGSHGPSKFMSDNRLGISKMLHRVSAMKSKNGDIIGLTYRIGRSVEGVSYMIKDIISKVAGYGGKRPKSVLLLGRPGVGKTTVLREVANILSSEFKRRVVVVDTSNEIAGDGDVPHPCIGQSRRVQVPHRDEQHAVLIETVQNHNPQVIIVDEIGTSKEVEAVRTITQRGVSMVGTAHGEDIHTLLKNPTLIGLIGGIQQVILSAAEAKTQRKDKDGVYKKTRLERAGAPTFEMVIELRERHKWRIHTNVADVVDKLLADMDPLVETRKSVGNRKIHSIFSNERSKEDWFEHLKQSTS